jgi:DNA repair protein RadC
MLIRHARLELRVTHDERLPSSIEGLSTWTHEKALSLHEQGMPPQEIGWALAVDNDQRILTFVEVARGTARQLPIHMPSLLAAVLTAGCDRFLFIHSHPGIDPTPSAQDMTVTDQIQAAAAACGLYFEDHIIVTSDPKTFLSMKQAGLYIPPVYRAVQAAT